MVQEQQKWRRHDGFKTFSEIKSTDLSNLSATVTGGGIDFKTGSRWNFENILLEPEREFDVEPEPKKGLGILGAELALRLGRQRRVPFGSEGPSQSHAAWALGVLSPRGEGSEGLGSLALAVTRFLVRHTAQASKLGHRPGNHKVGPG